MGWSRYILTADGEPIEVPDLLIWAEWFERADRTVAKTEIDGAMVSTVFLGLDHSFLRFRPADLVGNDDLRRPTE